MSAVRQLAIVFALAFAVTVVKLLWMAPRGSGGVAAVSVGISELIVDVLALTIAGFIGWRIWTFVRRSRARSHRSA